MSALRVLAAGFVLACFSALLVFSDSFTSAHGAASSSTAASPIDHVVVLYFENHSFDEVLGQVCIQDQRRNCDAASQGEISDGTKIDLKRAPDLVPPMGHGGNAHLVAINDGKMNGWDRVKGCERSTGYRCLAQYYPGQIPNTAELAREFAISDRTFELYPTPSWAAHMSLVAGTLDGFRGNALPQPTPGVNPGPGWGCNSKKVASWQSSPGAEPIDVPSCVPKRDGSGPFRASPVSWVPTIMDRMDNATPRVSWKIYSVSELEGPFSMCPTFAKCLYSSQANKVVQPNELETDAKNGTLPNVAIAKPAAGSNQHNGLSMAKGDNWLGSTLETLMNGPDWDSTAVFVTWDDCGCFYDHVPPPNNQFGIRLPMLIISPYAKRGYTDNRVATQASILAYIEHNFGLNPLSSNDRNAYDYSDSFDYTQAPLGPVPMTTQTIPKWEREYIRTHRNVKYLDAAEAASMAGMR